MTDLEQEIARVVEAAKGAQSVDGFLDFGKVANPSAILRIIEGLQDQVKVAEEERDDEAKSFELLKSLVDVLLESENEWRIKATRAIECLWIIHKAVNTRIYTGENDWCNIPLDALGAHNTALNAVKAARTEGLRKALEAVKEERLEGHERWIDGDQESDDSDHFYSNAIRDAENAISRKIAALESVPEESK